MKNKLFTVLLFLIINLEYTTKMNADNIKIQRVLNTGTANLCIAQDKDGLLWIATESGGLLSYDGYEVKKIKIGEETNLFEVVVFVFVDTEGIIWNFVQGQGVFSYDKNTCFWKNYNSVVKNSGSLTSNNVCWGTNIITEDKEGVIWIATDDGLNSYDRKTNKITQYRHIPDNANSLSNNSVRAVFTDKEGFVWIGTEDGLNCYNRKTNTFSRYKHDSNNINSLSANFIYTINEDKNGNIWIGTRYGGMCSFDKQTKSFTNYKHDPNNPNSLSCDDIYHIIVDRFNNLWICNEGGTGIDTYDIKTNMFKNYKYSPKDPNSINSNEILFAFEDNTGIIWLMDSMGGVNKCTLKQNIFKDYQYDPEDPFSLVSDNLARLHEDKKGNIWIGAFKSGLGLYVSENKFTSFKHVSNDPLSLPTHTVFSIIDAPNNKLWIGNFGGFIGLFDIETKRIIKSFKSPYPISPPCNLTIDNKRAELLWFASYFTDGLFSLNTTTGEFFQYKHDPANKSSVSNKNTFYILQDKDILWLGTGGDGLVKFDKTTEKCTYYKHDANDKNSISGNVVIESFIDSRGSFWITTEDGGLNRFDRQTEKFTSYGTEYGFISKSTRHILEDQEGFLWISTDCGIVKFDPKLLKVIKRFTEDNGLSSNQFDKIANALKDSSGNFWFSKVRGLCKFNPKEASKLEPNRHIPPIVLASFKSRKGETYNEDGLRKLKDITLTWTDNSFEFTFAALDYMDPGKNQYAYKLEGFDKDWNYIGTNHSGKYTNIPPGKYALCLKGSNNDGIWNEEGLSIKITIAPPFWMRWWFRGLVLIVLLGIIGGIFQLRTRALAKESIHMRDHAIAKTTSLVAHDVRKPFTSLKAMLEMFPTLSPEKIKTYSSDIDRSIRKVDAMLSDILEVSREVEYEFTPENILSVLDLAIKDVSSRYPDKKANFYYQLEPVSLINLDEHRMCRAFDNIMSNAFDFLPDSEGFMWFSIKQEGGKAKIVIGNSHSTIPEDKIKDIFQNKFTLGKKSGTGLGLSIVKKVINGHKGTVSAKNVKEPANFVPDELKYINGVEFEITLPLTEKPDYALKDPLLKNSEEAKSTFGMIQKSNQLAGSSLIDSLIGKLRPLEKKPNLFILDDESIYRTRVRDVLENLGEVYSLIHTYDASSYKEAIDLLNHAKMDFLICDIDLSDKQNTGFSVLSYAIKKYPECKVLMHTNRKDPTDIDEARKLGACGYCPKPITEAILVDLLLNNVFWAEVSKKEQVIQPSKYAKAVPNSKVLLVDDDQMNLEYKESFVMAFTDPKDNIQLYTAKTYEEATNIIDSVNPDVLITDFNLESNMTGVDICQYMKKKKSTTVCVVSSNMHNNELNKIKNKNNNIIDEVFSASHNMKDMLNTIFDDVKRSV